MQTKVAIGISNMNSLRRKGNYLAGVIPNSQVGLVMPEVKALTKKEGYVKPK